MLRSGGGAASGNAFVLRAPIAGRIAEVFAALGASYAEGAPLVPDRRGPIASSCRRRCRRSEAALSRARHGLALEIPGRADPIELKPDHVHDAGVIDPKTRALPVQIEVDNRDGQLLIGQTGTAILYTGGTQRVPVVPQDAVLMEAGRPYVFVQIARRALRAPVRRGRCRATATWSACGAGVMPGDRVVTRGAYDIQLASAAKGLPAEGHVALRVSHETHHSVVDRPHWLVIGLSLLLFGAGAWTARQMPIDVFPDLTAPTVTILTEGHGMAPEEMESLVTFPIESAINGASGVRRVRSATAVGIAVVWVEFDWGTDIFMARQLVSEKLRSSAARCRRRSSARSWRPCRPSWARSCSSRSRRTHDDPLTLRTIADTTVRRRLLAVPGVSQVTPIGGAERQFQVIAHPDALRANNVSLTELLAAVRGASQNTSAGIYTEGSQEYVLEAVGRVRDAGGDRRDGRGAARRPVGARAGRRGRARGRRVQARRRIAQRQAGRHRRRAEAARRQHDRGDAPARPRARHAAAASCPPA